MANWEGTSRSNYFNVKDIDAFETVMSEHEVRVEGCRSENGKVALFSATEFGGWPDIDFNTNEEIDFVGIVAEHLADGEVCILMSVGNEKTFYVTGNAVAFDNTGKAVEVSLFDIYKMAEDAFGKKPSAAEY